MAKLRRMVTEVTYIWYEAELTDEQAKAYKEGDFEGKWDIIEEVRSIVVELERAAELIEYLDKAGHPVKYQRITLQGLVGLLDSDLVKGGDDVPEGHYEEDNMKDTVVPNRNKIFSSLFKQ